MKCGLLQAFGNYGLLIIKIQDSVSQKLRILCKLDKKGYSKQKCHASQKPKKHLVSFTPFMCLKMGGDFSIDQKHTDLIQHHLKTKMFTFW